MVTDQQAYAIFNLNRNLLSREREKLPFKNEGVCSIQCDHTCSLLKWTYRCVCVHFITKSANLTNQISLKLLLSCYLMDAHTHTHAHIITFLFLFINTEFYILFFCCCWEYPCLDFRALFSSKRKLMFLHSVKEGGISVWRHFLFLWKKTKNRHMRAF